MSAGSRKRNRDKRLIEKRKKKASNKALYEARARAGENGKSVRFRRKSAGYRNPLKGTHPNGRCGNPACRRCFYTTEKGVYQRKAMLTLDEVKQLKNK